MKTFLKKHGFVLILFFILTWAIYNGSQIFVKQMDRNEKKTAQILADCKKNMSESEDLNYKKMCENLINNNLPDLDFFTMLTNLVVFELRYLNFIALFIVVLPSMKVAKLLKSKYILHSATRESYRSFLITFLKKRTNMFLSFHVLVVFFYFSVLFIPRLIQLMPFSINRLFGKRVEFCIPCFLFWVIC